MRAVVITPAPDGGKVAVEEVLDPRPDRAEVLVRVHACGVNRGDIVARKALRAGDPQRCGVDFAGEVIELGRDAQGPELGARVMGHWRGGQAEFIAVDPRLLVRIPERLSWVGAAAWLNVFVTSHDALVTNARVKSGESVLVNAASSGVGIASLQVARWAGAKPVIGSSRTRAKLSNLKPYGLEIPIDASRSDWPDTVLEATQSKGVDIVVDCVGADVFGGNLKCMALHGRLVSVGRLSGIKSDIDLDKIAYQQLRIIGVTFRTRSLEERIACVQRCAADLLEPLRRGDINPVVDRELPIDQVAEAHEYIEKNQHIGKVVLTIRH